MKDNKNDSPQEALLALYHSLAIRMAEKSAKSLNQVETGVFMIMSSYLIDPKAQDVPALQLVTTIIERKGQDALIGDLRENGIEATPQEVSEALVKLLSFAIESGMTTLSLAIQSCGNEFIAPPGKKDFDIEDLGIEDPFKKNDES
jgi:hypothetical protein